MNPPPVGEALSAGWEVVRPKLVPIVVATLCAALLSLIPLAGIGLTMAGLAQISLKALRGEEVEPEDAFVAFRQAPADHMVMGLLQILGLIACGVGAWVTQGLFLWGTFFILDHGMTWSAAKDRCLAEVGPNWLPWTLFTVVCGLVGSLGGLLCGVGVLFTTPIAVTAFAYAYERSWGRGAAAPRS